MKPEKFTKSIIENQLSPALGKAIIDGNFTKLEQYHVIRRNSQLTNFDVQRIIIALTRAFLAIEGDSATDSSRIKNSVILLTQQVIKGISRRLHEENTVHIEDIQDQIELSLMRAGYHKIARSYVIYREEHAHIRAEKHEKHTLNIVDENGRSYPLTEDLLRTQVIEACINLDYVTPSLIIEESLKNIFDGISKRDINHVLVMTTRTLIEKEPNYTYVAARLLLGQLRSEALNFVNFRPNLVTAKDMIYYYPSYFKIYLQYGIKHELLDSELANFDLNKLGNAIVVERDLQFTYLGLQTLYDRYFLSWDNKRFELPQAFFMRVAMGLSINESDREASAIDIYHALSKFDFMTSTPTLFNSGTLRPQLSSCYLTTVPDDLDGIFSAIKDNALLSKFAGGLGNDWTPVRGMGSHIKGTNGKSQGIVPFLKVFNDTLVAVNQCFAPETQVFTADGTKKIKDIKVGDLVLGQRGQYREVTEHLCYNQIDKMVELNIKHSVEPLKVTAGHPFWAIQDIPMGNDIKRTSEWLEKGKVKPDWIEAGKLQKGDYVGQVIPEEIINIPEFTKDDAHLYGIMLGDGHCSKREFNQIHGDSTQGIRFEWGVSGNSYAEASLAFVRDYLNENGIHFWESNRGENYLQLRWSFSKQVERDATTGQFIAGEPVLPFDFDDLYDTQGKKRIARKFAHLPPEHTLSMLQGLIESDGGISRGKEIYFTNTSQSLIEGVRYQCLRLGIPVAGQYRERENSHTGTRANGDKIQFNGTTKAYDLRIPAVPKLASLVGCQPLTKYNWLQWQGCLFSRVKEQREVDGVPFIYDLKVEGDHTYMTTAALVHNGGRRRGSGCAYLETWHIDIEEFLELRKNTGDERRRAHDMSVANWIPDLFMQRVHENGQWTLFSPDEVIDLHELYGEEFKQAYENYESLAEQGKLKLYKKMSAVELWRKMLTMLFETGHPWMTFKDPCNIRSPQQHVGVVHSSNLCTEITLNTKAGEEVAVCNLSSINLPAHIKDGQLDVEKIKATVKTAMRALDNVININYYAIPEARTANLRHRAVGLGVMGFQDALYKLRIPYASEAAVKFADYAQEVISYYAISASADLAEERGSYSSFVGSLWSQGILPIDSIQELAKQRGEYLDMDTSSTLDWDRLRERVKKGMRNSNTMAIAPTATISSICGVTQSIEPLYQNLFIKSNLSGEFTIINPYLVEDLKKLNLWDEVMINDMKYCDGRIKSIDRIPDELKDLYSTAFEIEPTWLIEAASRRQKWIDQAQSLNLYILEPSGRKLDSLYKLAWLKGLKTTYYMRAMGATRIAKSTVSQYTPEVCNIDDESCESCQ